MAKHQELNTKDLLEWVESAELDYAFRVGHGKTLKLSVTPSGGYRVYVNKELVCETNQAFVAVEKYNSYL